MKMLVSDPSPSVMAYYENLMRTHGIGTNYKYGPPGYGPSEIWVMKDEHFDRAQALVRRYPATPVQQDGDWVCPRCKEAVEGVFECCWNCETSRPKKPNHFPQPTPRAAD